MGQKRHLTGLNPRAFQCAQPSLSPVNDTFAPDAALNFSAALSCVGDPLDV
ncbi:hypothetical protein SAMN04490208_0669 [Pseudomonas poae]|uniref:Uncharacterized protein n=1 Tax=Pseudomonas poae TaxID=200451 RepID=A0ABY0RBS0_9PSED|nr:hypothetical protein [Pseudomonas sp. 25 E 4]SDN55197.1 hypothetical protein SAMN04490208_0669 [Pseudomonas poae]